MSNPPRYWFPAKRYGWGWGPPATWEGWAVFLGFFASLFAGVALFPPRRHMAEFIAFVAALSLLLLVVCWVKGEPPRWRWGGRDAKPD